MKGILVVVGLAFACTGWCGGRYAYLRSFEVDGRPVLLSENETELDLAKLLPEKYASGGSGTDWATVESVVESEEEKDARLYYRNEWFGEIFVNGSVVLCDGNGPAEDFATVDIRLRKGKNTICLRTKCGQRGWHCALALDGERRPGEPDAMVDLTRNAGKIRPLLHSSGFGPLICSCPKSSLDAIRSMNFAAARTHDWALINPNERVCDYFHVFPLMRLDAAKAENYHFGPTDYLLRRTREETGSEIFYRLGTSIEHSGEMVHFNTRIPEDFDKVAEIFAGTVRHYNRGWADGFNWNIRYWELWNEPDGQNNMWCLPDGDTDPDPKVAAKKTMRRQDLFIRFFITCLRRLKSEFPDIKVGGPALCTMNRPYFTELLKACRAANVTPDFISWHYYGAGVGAILGSVADARKMCDELGFPDCELVLNEWHYLGCKWAELRSADPKVQDRVWNGPSSHNGTDAAAFTLSVLARFQASALDQGCYYGCRHTGAWGFADERGHLYKTYYALTAFGEIVKDFPVLGEVRTEGSLTTLVAKSADGRRTVLLAADYRGCPGDIVIDVKGLPSVRPSARILDHARNLEPVEVRVDGTRLILPKEGRDSASYVVVWNSTGTHPAM